VFLAPGKDSPVVVNDDLVTGDVLDVYRIVHGDKVDKALKIVIAVRSSGKDLEVEIDLAGERTVVFTAANYPFYLELSMVNSGLAMRFPLSRRWFPGVQRGLFLLVHQVGHIGGKIDVETRPSPFLQELLSSLRTS
jgi:hypothetical protein